MTHKLIGYSERGLVNALVHHSAPGFIRSVLELVEWNGVKPPWSDSEDFKATLYVETSFGPYFGDPDLLLVVEAAGRKYVIFVEAKIVAYRDSARPDDYASGKKGFNSCINGQLILKYRLAQALSRYQEGNSKLEEPEEIAKSYAAMMNDTKQRYAFPSKPNLLRKLVEQLKVPDDISSYYYIALTKDETNPFSKIAHAPGQSYPVYYAAGNQLCREAWERTGWLGWDKIENRLKLSQACEEFKNTWELTF